MLGCPSRREAHSGGGDIGWVQSFSPSYGNTLQHRFRSSTLICLAQVRERRYPQRMHAAARARRETFSDSRPPAAEFGSPVLPMEIGFSAR
jgi:hypothetical protein